MSLPTVGFAGMTHLGLVSGAAAAAKGFRVVCFDPDPARIASIVKRQLPVAEPQLAELLHDNAARLILTSRPADLAQCSVVFVAADVSTDGTGLGELGPIDQLLTLVLDATGEDAAIVVLSQVPPGYTRRKRRAGRDVYYQVETLVFGQAVDRALNPERQIVGCYDPAQDLHAGYSNLLAVDACPVLRMRYESAELAKISINMCLASSICTANTLAEICEKIGADWSEIVPALKLDRRIGQHAYLAPGLGIAGGNLERDLAAVRDLADRLHTEAGIVKAWTTNSLHRKEWAARTLRAELLESHPEALVAIWGLAYKENTDSVKNSASLATIALLPSARLKLHDPQVGPDVVGHGRAQRMDEPLSAASEADALMILTPWPQYGAIAPEEIAKVMRGRIVLDPYGMLDAAAANAAGLILFTLGRPAAWPRVPSSCGSA